MTEQRTHSIVESAELLFSSSFLQAPGQNPRHPEEMVSRNKNGNAKSSESDGKKLLHNSTVMETVARFAFDARWERHATDELSGVLLRDSCR